MSNPKLSLEILSGPLDGHVVTIEDKTEWSKEGRGPLSFPWDEELGIPQARFFIESENWWLEASSTRRNTRHNVERIEGKVPLEVFSTRRSTRHNMERIEGKVPLEVGDLLKASNTWLLISQIE